MLISCTPAQTAGNPIYASALRLSATDPPSQQFGATAVVEATPDDNNPCTSDSCSNGQPSHTNLPAGTSCEDGNYCNGTETCNGSGTCLAGTPPTITDANPCEKITCDNNLGLVASPITPPPSGCAAVSINAPPQPNAAVPANFPDSIQFLYTGQNAVQFPQVGGPPLNIDQTRVGVIRGRVLQGFPTTGHPTTPLGGVTVSILNHPEFGYTLTRSDGWYDLAVSAGGELVVQYQDAAAGYLGAQRHPQTRWLDFSVLDDVVLMPKDTTANSPIASNNGTWASAKGSSVMDSDGTRQAYVFFPPGTTATFVVNGQQQP